MASSWTTLLTLGHFPEDPHCRCKQPSSTPSATRTCETQTRSSPQTAPQFAVRASKLNPMAPFKTAWAVHILDASVQSKGSQARGPTIVEKPPRGNTGQGVAMWAVGKGGPCVFTCRQDEPGKRKNLDAQVSGPRSSSPITEVRAIRPALCEAALRIRARSRWPSRQPSNTIPASISRHREVTAPEDWEDTGGKLTHSGGVGTGGTL